MVFFYPQILKELNLDHSLVSNTNAKQILRSLKSEAAKPSTLSFFVSDTRQLRNRTDQNPPLRILDRQLSNPETNNPTKEKSRKKKIFFPTNDDNDDDDKNYESSKESFATSTKEWKSYYQ